MAYIYPFRDADEALKSEVWRKAIDDPDNSNKDLMRDKCRVWMRWSEHGNRESVYGWEIDRIRPQAKGGTDEISNLQPLNWRNNSAKGDSYPWSCPESPSA